MRVHSARLKRKTRIKRIHAALNRDIKLSWDAVYDSVFINNRVGFGPSTQKPMNLSKRYRLVTLVAALEAE